MGNNNERYETREWIAVEYVSAITLNYANLSLHVLIAC